MTMLRLMKERHEIGVVADQIGAPTWANSLADVVWRFADRSDASGIYHWTDAGSATWFEFAVAIRDEAFKLGLLDRRISVRRIRTEDYPALAQRPGYSVVDCSATIAALGVEPGPWRSRLRAMLEELGT